LGVAFGGSVGGFRGAVKVLPIFPSFASFDAHLHAAALPCIMLALTLPGSIERCYRS